MHLGNYRKADKLRRFNLAIKLQKHTLLCSFIKSEEE